MQCTKCGFTLVPGQGFCNNCGTPVAGSRPSYDPTVLAPQPGSNPGYNPAPQPGYNPGYNPAPQPGPTPGYDPTILAPSSGSGTPPMPSTAYGADPYAPPPASPYAPPPMGQYAPAPAPYAPPTPGVPYAPGPGPYMPPAAPPKSNKTLWIVLSVILGVVVLACTTCVGVTYFTGKNAVSNVNATATALASNTNGPSTPTAGLPNSSSSNSSSSTSSGSAPTVSNVDPAAQAVITSIQMASAVNEQTGSTTPASTFNSGQTVYAVFNITKGSPGYLTSRWYIDGQLNHNGKVYPINPTDSEFYISLPISATGQGVVGIYWCTQASCSDAKLAQVGTFTVQ